MLTGIKIDNFTAFEQLDIRLSKGVNVILCTVLGRKMEYVGEEI